MNVMTKKTVVKTTKVTVTTVRHVSAGSPCSNHYPYIPAINATFFLTCTTLFCYPWFLSFEFQEEKPILEIVHRALHILTFILTFIPNFACASQLCNNQFGISKV